MAPTKSTTQKEEPREAPQDVDQPPKLSAKAPETGGHLWYRGDYGPVFALVISGSPGEAEVLLLRPDEVVKGRTVAVYDTAEDAERGHLEGRQHVAWHI